MATSNLRNIGEAIGLLAVVGSLVFVGFQMKQDRVLVRTELGSSSFEQMLQINQTINDSEFAAVYAKMLKTPHQLSDEEMIRVNAFLRQVADTMARECYVVERGVFTECNHILGDSIQRYFGNAYAQTWWKLSDTRTQVKLPDWVDEEISNTPSDAELRRIRAIQNEVSKPFIEVLSQ